MHEVFRNSATRANAKSLNGVDQGHTGGLDRNKDRGFVADRGGSASRMDRRGSWFNPDELDALDKRRKSPGREGLKGCRPLWEARTVGRLDAQGVGERFGAVPLVFWVEACRVGWPDVSSAY
jgi:hypothetical protein